METKNYPDKKDLYRLPWSMNDNPIGWVEVTDICNLKCKGCYRLIVDGHKPVEQIKEEILFLKKWRNCDVISIAGGEAIIHPNIVDLISFVKKNKMKTMILTNGYALDEKLLRNMKNAGLTGISFHIDTTQIRPEFKKQKLESEEELNNLRLNYAKMAYNVGGLGVTFGITVHAGNFGQIPSYIQWAIDHMKYINALTFITYRGLPVMEGIEYYNSNGNKVNMKSDSLGYTISEEEAKEINLTSKDVYSMIKKYYPDYEATSYLGGTADHTSLKWLIGNFITNSKGKTFGAYGKKTMEIVQTAHHFIKGTYLVHSKNRIGRELFLMAFFDTILQKGLWKYLRYLLLNPFRIFYRVNAIGIGIIQAPDLMPDGTVNMCDDCPDMCVHEGKLVYSCRLDECRFHGGLLHVHRTHSNCEKTEPLLENI